MQKWEKSREENDREQTPSAGLNLPSRTIVNHWLSCLANLQISDLSENDKTSLFIGQGNAGQGFSKHRRLIPRNFCHRPSLLFVSPLKSRSWGWGNPSFLKTVLLKA